jgi:hypothetical protein
MNDQDKAWLDFLLKEKVLLKCPEKEERFVVIAADMNRITLRGILDDPPSEVRLEIAQLDRLLQEILASRDGVALENELSGAPAKRAVASSFATVCYSPPRKALVAIPDDTAAREAFLDLLTHWDRTVAEYKPLVLLAVVDGLVDGQLSENRIAFSWLSEAFARQSTKRGLPREARRAAMPFYRLTTDLFWMASIKDVDNPPTDRAGSSVSRIEYAFIREPFWTLLQDLRYREEIESILVSMLPNPSAGEPQRRFFVEKTSVADHPDRKEGLNALGKALWSPQTDKVGKRIYTRMEELRPGDVVFHLVDNREIVGFSTVANSVDNTFICLPDTPWAGRPGFRVALRDFTALNPGIHRDWILRDTRYQPTLTRLLERGSRVFYNKGFDLNQGAYLTDIPPELLHVFNDAYRTHTGKELPFRGGPPTEPQIAEMIDTFVQEAERVGLAVDSDVVHRLIALLLAKPFLILTGLSGSGKTKLAQAIAKFLCPRDSESVRVIPVGADWTSNENVVGYPDGLDATNYIAQPALKLVLDARENPTQPFFLILDEMNLSHVERYFSDFLSGIESGEPIPLYNGADRRASGRPIPSELILPSNLFVIGTVNVDETTYMFSPKVLDRAGVIEFRVTGKDIDNLLLQPRAPDVDQLAGSGLAYSEMFVNAARNQTVLLSPEIQQQFAREMKLFFELFHSCRMEFGFRVVHEAARFVNAYRLLGGYSAEDTGWFVGAFDAVIVQKLLPKIHGSRARLEGLLWALYFACVAGRGGDLNSFREACLNAGRAEDEARYSPENVSPDGEGPTYPLSADKVRRMWERVVRDQFVSFAEA